MRKAEATIKIASKTQDRLSEEDEEKLHAK